MAPSVTVTGVTGFGNTQVLAEQLVNGWKPGDMMTCTDCHGNDDQGTGASHGPHASAVKYILKGPNTQWPTQSNGTTRWTYTNRTTGQGTAAGLFCLNCHSATLPSIPHSNRSDHTGLACTYCHIRVPHGGKVARLIRTANTPAPYVDTGTTSTMNSYNHAASIAEGNCGAGCSSKHPLAPTTTNSW